MIPASEVDDIRLRVVAAQQAHHAEAEVELAKTRARGHHIGVPGVGLLKQVLNATQCFAPYLADERILGIAESFFGDFVRVSFGDLKFRPTDPPEMVGQDLCYCSDFRPSSC